MRTTLSKLLKSLESSLSSPRSAYYSIKIGMKNMKKNDFKKIEYESHNLQVFVFKYLFEGQDKQFS